MNARALHALSETTLRSLSRSLREGSLALGFDRRAIEQLTGSEWSRVLACLEDLAATGMQSAHIAHLIDAVVRERQRSPDLALLFDLVLSGPEVGGVPTADTAAVVNGLIGEANEEILLIGYAVHNGKKLFAPLAQRIAAIPSMRVIFYLNVARPYGDTSLDMEILRRFISDFREKHWPARELPEIYYDPRSLAMSPAERASLHAKCLIIDRKAAIITSANFTEAAQRKNIEVGVTLRHQPTVHRLVSYFEALRQTQKLVRCRF